MEGTKAVDFKQKLLQILQNLAPDMNLIIGQAIDGFSTMSGRNGGLQSFIRELVPSALYCNA